MSQHPKVFISYSWDSEEHKEWVLNLANKLRSDYGIDVILDQYDLKAGKVMTRFMEKSIGIADKVVLILTPYYKLKAEKSMGGVGFEHSMISQALFETQSDNTKFIPVLRSGTSKDSAPGYIKTLIYHSMSDDMIFESSLWELARLIWDKPQSIVEDLEDLLEEQSVKMTTFKIINSDKLKFQLSEGEIEEVLKKLLTLNDDRAFKNQILLLKQRYLEYKRQSNIGTVSFDDFMVERTRITATILEFIDNLENKV